MNVHNIMEDIVADAVGDVFDEEEQNRKQGICTCDQCRIDVTCYVLNRTKPQYIFSGRGLAHLKTDYQNNLQKMADLLGLVNTAIKKVNAAKRPRFAHKGDHESFRPGGPLFNFPTIMGKIFSGTNFEPLKDVSVFLMHQGSPITMINPNWQNPYPVSEKTAGTFLFWPYPSSAEREAETKIFEFEVTTERGKFEELHYYFNLELTAQAVFNDSIHLQQTFELEPLYLFPR
ncbi:MAG: competence protein ComFB [Spirochaetales bacterium]|nr:MAG: competence protein ComFB [Spirochaetales bacterium]